MGSWVCEKCVCVVGHIMCTRLIELMHIMLRSHINIKHTMYNVYNMLYVKRVQYI